MSDGQETAAGQRVALWVTALGSFLAPFMGSSINIALPVVGQELAADAVLLSWVGTAYSLSAATFLLPFGKVADMWGRKKVFAYGMAFYALASLLCGLAGSTGWLVAFRVLQGIGSTMVFGTGVAILTSVFPARERGRALGLNVTATYLGLSLGPFLGGFMTQSLGWRSIFFAQVPLGLLGVALVAWRLKGEWTGTGRGRFDWRGSLLYSLSLVVFMYGFPRLPAATGGLLAAGGVLGLVLFVAWETRAETPLVNTSLFRGNVTFTLSNLAALINYSATSAVSFLLSLYLQYIQGFSPQEAGVILVAQPVMMALFSSPAGRLSDRVEPRVVASAGMALVAAGLLPFIFVNSETSLLLVVGSLLVLGLGFALFSSPNMNAIMGSVGQQHYGVASAMVGTMRLLGQMLSMGVATLILALYVGPVQITPDYHPPFIQSVRTAFVVFAALCVIGVFASLGRGKMRKGAG
ncbi:MAG: MFS transporter [Anaerolineae bacterium]|nr:MFS transporter [Anaerolineae bacterium]